MALSNSVLSANHQLYVNAGEVEVCRALDPRFRIDTWIAPGAGSPGNNAYNGSNQGVQGWKNSDVITNLSAMLALKPDLLIIAIGINSLSTPGVVVAGQQMGQILASCRSALPRVPIIFGNLRATAIAKEGGGFPKASILAQNALYAPLENRSNGMFLWDAYTAYNSGNGYGLDAWYTDGLHPSPLGILQGIRGNGPHNSSLLALIKDRISAGNIFLNIAGTSIIGGMATLQGTGGRLNGIVTGGVATSMGANNPTSGSTAASLEANPETGGQSQILDITPGGSAVSDFSLFSPYVSTINTTAFAGQWAQMWAELEYDNWPYWSFPRIYFADTDSVFMTAYGAPYGGETFIFTSPQGRYWAATQKILIPADSTQVAPAMRLYFVPNGASGVGRVKVRRWQLQTVPNPIPDYA